MIASYSAFKNRFLWSLNRASTSTNYFQWYRIAYIDTEEYGTALLASLSYHINRLPSSIIYCKSLQLGLNPLIKWDHCTKSLFSFCNPWMWFVLKFILSVIVCAFYYQNIYVYTWCRICKLKFLGICDVNILIKISVNWKDLRF